MCYKSTRGGESHVSSSRAVINGLAEDGGLYVPERLPVLPLNFADDMREADYKQVALAVMTMFFDDFTVKDLKQAIESAYDDKFDSKNIVEIVKAGNYHYLELFHGPTIAFKDMALAILPYLMTLAAKIEGIKDEICILTATSGDTGKAALAAFADVPQTKIMVFYPKNGVSRIQELQMVTQKGGNVSVVSIKGNFDDAQSGVKAVFSDKEFAARLGEKGVRLSSANSISIGRLIPQVVYYVYSYVKLLHAGLLDENKILNVVVPSGNFGNILAAYIAKQMGVPLGKLICASNENNVLTDFINTGVYDTNRPFYTTTSPSMDILVSSNLERLLYYLSNGDCARVAGMMESLTGTGRYEIDENMKAKLRDFCGYYVDMAAVAERIGQEYGQSGYCLDPHTAVGAVAADRFFAHNPGAIVIASTASPYKFADTVLNAIGGTSGKDDFETADKLCELSKVKVPRAVNQLKNARIRHEKLINKDEMFDAVKSFA